MNVHKLLRIGREIIGPDLLAVKILSDNHNLLEHHLAGIPCCGQFVSYVSSRAAWAMRRAPCSMLHLPVLTTR